jgi:hypothetical protein
MTQWGQTRLGSNGEQWGQTRLGSNGVRLDWGAMGSDSIGEQSSLTPLPLTPDGDREGVLTRVDGRRAAMVASVVQLEARLTDEIVRARAPRPYS